MLERGLQGILVIRLDLPPRLGRPRDGTRGPSEAREVRPPYDGSSLLSLRRGRGTEPNGARQGGRTAGEWGGGGGLLQLLLLLQVLPVHPDRQVLQEQADLQGRTVLQVPMVSAVNQPLQVLLVHPDQLVHQD